MTDASTERARHYPNFDLVRHFMALSVLVMHCVTHAGMSVEGNFLAVPFFAVPAFLAVSGFLVLQSYERTGSWGKFIWKRALRILPAFLASLVLVGCLLGPAAISEALRTWYTLGMPLGNANAPLWSLGWEELFYLLLAILFALGAYRRPRAIWILWAFSFLGFFALLLLFKRTVLDIGVHLASAFFIGNLFYLNRERVFLLRTRPWIPCLVVLLVVATYPFRGPSLAVQSLHQAFLVFGVLLFSLAGPTLLPRRIPDLSYGLYIYHWPIMIALLMRGVDSPTALTLGTLGVTGVLAALSWYGLEKPALSLKQAFDRKRHLKAVQNDLDGFGC